ncbi:hypothetical protein [Rubellicoccus peritrichatus]|uniref:Uncharacterized protein n=1 Tax=Rubellicoccus peritrichatus TaxID=3080537 RepID=A0AAQ3QQL6_9BACT|nr:hypothetical protein [Puniceicoccus sp. CR14]WOO40388.1 hypothetical protein RZN69_17350 [Puniceicoccus sp. CR14]WOO40437.1 hypothetical protein RZN69_17595 [Puniceicoccus sp. CR14]WOO40486.1 hypothetical protein RZN69_17840 [Puniceicoccus sp. CR14]WOO40535.1 hypothetical protein RZN69_18085 [Puniceicoccus sp. CR14]
MKLTLNPINTFEVLIGEASLGQFTMTDEWNGLSCLEAGEDKLIVIREEDYARLNVAIWYEDQREGVSFVTGTPSILERIKELSSGTTVRDSKCLEEGDMISYPKHCKLQKISVLENSFVVAS